jgi:hypothetical protein
MVNAWDYGLISLAECPCLLKRRYGFLITMIPQDPGLGKLGRRYLEPLLPLPANRSVL